MKTTTLQLPETVLQKAVAKARRLGVSQSKVLREAIEKDLAEEKSGATMLDVMGELVGCIRGGPPDLSRRHKEYYRQAILKKYGKNHR
jgi:Arc/MetJ-type ribon-helix-helix transcriptional regulator